MIYLISLILTQDQIKKYQEQIRASLKISNKEAIPTIDEITFDVKLVSNESVKKIRWRSMKTLCRRMNLFRSVIYIHPPAECFHTLPAGELVLQCNIYESAGGVFSHFAGG